MKQLRIGQIIGYFAFLYLIFLLIFGVGYPLAVKYARPLAQFIFPINERDTHLKAMIVMSFMYWSMVIAYIAVNRKNISS